MTSVKSVKNNAVSDPAEPHRRSGPRACGHTGASKRTRALSPSRLAVLRELEQHPTPITLTCLAKIIGLHENTVRGHLEALLIDGYVMRTQGPSDGRGRPAWLWRAVVTQENEYAHLATALAATIHRTAPAPELAARETGHEWGKSLAGQLGLYASKVRGTSDTEAAATHITGLLAHLGFAPRLSDTTVNTGAGTAVSGVGTDERIELTQCPLIDAARKYPGVVCSVHLGLIEGVAHTLGHDATGTQLIPFATPDACALHLRLRSATTPHNVSSSP